MEKRQIIALLACLIVGLAGFVGAITTEQSRLQSAQEADDNRQELSKETDTIVSPQPKSQNSTLAEVAKAMEEASEEKERVKEDEEATETMASESVEKDIDVSAEFEEGKKNNQDDEESVETIAEQKDDVLHFTPQDGLRWPLEGDVLLNYSMDHRIYFPTLEQYQYNPGLIIGGEVNSKVYIIAEGTITDISTNEETGCTVTEDLGDGYTAVYGQLKELNFSVGDHVERGQVVGYVSEPTKYYSVEGSNLYFAMKKDGDPIDPLEYYE